ncbi:MAG TPA: PQQ-binding-like beta-propeller repeat protein [Gemmataceae bacterium]|nr:PQQ-binding-like beta-propeller repeat protein [Gemmataceae bacterium]
MPRRAFLGLLGVALLCGLQVAISAGEADVEQAADAKTLQDAGVATDGPSLLAFFRKRTLADGDHARFQTAIRQLGDDDFQVREKATNELKAAGRAVLPYLRLAARDPDAEVAHRARRCLAALDESPELSLLTAAARHLAVRKPAQTVNVLLAYLPMVDDDYVREAVLQTLAKVGLNDGEVHPALVRAAKAELPARRAAAAYVLSRAGTAYRDPVARLLADSDPHVRLEAATGLVRKRDKSGVAVLIALLTDGPRETAWRAEDLLSRLGPGRTPPVSLGRGDEADRKNCREAWENWWKANAGEVDFGQLELEESRLGLTVICDCDVEGKYRVGNVWECAADGKPRWQVKNLKNPADVQLLPGGRFLVAECQGFAITERDRQGTVLWSQAVSNYPVSCQRLPNGNTFIATYSELFEVTRDGKKVYSYDRPGSIYCATKLRNGNILYAHSSSGIVELGPSGKEVRTVPVQGLAAWASVEQLPNGRYLVSQYGNNRVIEIDETGRVQWECTVQTPAWATRLPNGNTLVASTEGHSVVEVDRAGKEIWKRETTGRPFRVRRH